MIDRRKNRIYFRFHQNGYLYPADNYAASQLRSRSYKSGDVVSVSITKLRSPGFNRLAHKIGQLVAANIDDFHGMDAHKALKRLQLEANAACEEVVIKPDAKAWITIRNHWMWPGIRHGFDMLKKLIGIDLLDDGKAVVLIPKGLSFESLDEGEFNEAIKKICNHIVDRYWPSETPESVVHLANEYAEAA
jgi:hypothetical protein